MSNDRLLKETLEAARRDAQTVTTEGASLAKLPDGCVPRPAIRHIDNSGSVVEILDQRWGWHSAPIEFVYSFMIRPGVVKGWGLHERHDDRYFLISGEMELVMYDVRPDSPTYGKVSTVYMSDKTPQIVNIPAYVWHADRNIGTSDAIVVNFPTEPYSHTSPDKFKLPIDTPLIPHSFGTAEGG